MNIAAFLRACFYRASLVAGSIFAFLTASRFIASVMFYSFFVFFVTTAVFRSE